MEKVTFKNSKGLNLVGALYPSNSNKAVIISHGFTSNKDRERLVKLSETLNKKNFAVLRFDFGGCGESDEREITIKEQINDLGSAIDFMRQKGYTKIGLLGESLGALTSILSYDEEIKTLVLWAPVTSSNTPSIFEKEESQKELNERGFIIHQRNEKEFKIPKEYLEEKQAINQKEILSKIKSPILIIHGDKDDTVPIEHSKEALKYLPSESKLEIISGATHKLEEDINKVLDLSLNWIEQHL